MDIWEILPQTLVVTNHEDLEALIGLTPPHHTHTDPPIKGDREGIEPVTSYRVVFFTSYISMTFRFD